MCIRDRVYESWEGSHNVLVAQVLNDLRRLPILDEVDRWLRAAVAACADGDLATRLGEELEGVLAATRSCMVDASVGDWQFRDVVGRLGLLAEACLLAEAGEDALARHLFTTRLANGYRCGDDGDLVARVQEVLSLSLIHI